VGGPGACRTRGPEGQRPTVGTEPGADSLQIPTSVVGVFALNSPSAQVASSSRHPANRWSTWPAVGGIRSLESGANRGRLRGNGEPGWRAFDGVGEAGVPAAELVGEVVVGHTGADLKE
jgi:hypothetical protein